MFNNLVKDNYKVSFFEKSNCYTFEIPNFFSEEQYDILYKNLPNIERGEAANHNLEFYDKSKQNQLKDFISEVNGDRYNKTVGKSLILNEFVQQIKDPKFINILMKTFYFKILKSRVYDPKNFLKLLIRKNRGVKQKSSLLIDKFLYNDIITTVEFAYMYNGAKSYPHTDGMKKIMSLLLYFPDENMSDETSQNLGTTFYTSNEFNLQKKTSKNNINTYEESENFKRRNNKSMTLPFKKKNLYGFIKSHKSWHSVEPFDIHPDFVRKNININMLLI